MKRILFSTFYINLLEQGFELPAQSNKCRQWYKQCTSNWSEAFPIGNEQFDAMVFGNPLHTMANTRKSVTLNSLDSAFVKF